MINKFNELNIKYKIIIIVLIIIICSVLIKILINTPEKQLKNYFNKNYYINEYEGNTYSKPISELNLEEYNTNIKNNVDAKYEMNYFNIKTHEFSKNKREYENNVESNLNETYAYKTDIITYNYRVVIENIATAIYRGTYNTNTKDLICKLEYKYNIEANDNDKLICNNIKDELLAFESEAYTIIDNKIIDILKK